MTRLFRTRCEQEQQGSPTFGWASQPSYPIHAPIAIYGRQSTKNQVENNRESYEAQTKDLLKRALDMGWKEGNIIVYVENIRNDGAVRSASGRLRIDQREGLSALVERIEQGEIKAVMVYQEDRLFRDETGIQYNVFIDICKRNSVLVITPLYIYDFNNDRYAIRLFRDKMQQAADFFTDYSKRLCDLRQRVSERGGYDGRGIAVGYTVDRNRNSPTFKKYLIYEPHAEVVRWLFRRYRELCGNLHALCRELNQLTFVFPPFQQGIELTRYQLSRSPSGGYLLSRSGLKFLLTNVVYIGWWMFQESVVQKDNHPAIVDEDDFWYAFHRLSPILPDGAENTHYSPQVRKGLKEGHTPALLTGVIEAEDGSLYPNNQHDQGPCYTIVDMKTQSPHTVYLYSVRARFLDRIFVERMLDIAKNEYLGDDILAAIEQLQKQKQEPLVSVDD